MRLGASPAILVLAASCVSAFPRTVESSKGAWNSVCPDRLEDIEQGAFCADDGAFDGAEDTIPVCDYDEGYCACERAGCTAADPACEPRWEWRCKKDEAWGPCPVGRREIPMREGDPCVQNDGTTCSYELASCTATLECRGGRWRLAAPRCPP